jgi:hypothetical protein
VDTGIVHDKIVTGALAASIRFLRNWRKIVPVVHPFTVLASTDSIPDVEIAAMNVMCIALRDRTLTNDDCPTSGRA